MKQDFMGQIAEYEEFKAKHADLQRKFDERNLEAQEKGYLHDEMNVKLYEKQQELEKTIKEHSELQVQLS
jgi:hypothetical protein